MVRTSFAVALAFALPCAGCEAPSPAACMPPARAYEEAQTIEITTPEGAWAQRWYCVDPPPASLLDGSYRFDLIWVEGETCDPCDLERIAGLASSQVCSNEPPLRLLCGPIAYPLEPWDRKGCVYAVASTSGCQY